MNTYRIVIFCLLFTVFGCFSVEHTEVQLASRDNNFCKVLKGRVVVYAIFVDSKYTNPWSDYDVRSTTVRKMLF